VAAGPAIVPALGAVQVEVSAVETQERDPLIFTAPEGWRARLMYAVSPRLGCGTASVPMRDVACRSAEGPGGGDGESPGVPTPAWSLQPRKMRGRVQHDSVARSTPGSPSCGYLIGRAVGCRSGRDSGALPLNGLV
jgi:hypothetical protein